MEWFCYAKFPLDANLSDIDALLTQHNIPHRFTEEQGEQLLWITDPNTIPLINQILQGEVQAASSDIIGRSGQGASSNFFANFLTTLFHSPICILTVLLGWAGFIILNFVSSEWVAKHLLFVHSAEVTHFHHYWKLITPAFVHFSWMHVIFNTLWIWEFGSKIEAHIGKFKSLVLFLLIALTSNLIQYFSMKEPGYFGGLSGVVYGYMGFVWYMAKFHQVAFYRMIPQGIFMFMFVWLVLGFSGLIDLFIPGSVANWAHLGGLVGGVALAKIYSLIWPQRQV
ncbi:rhomboid family intramembrane serine protease [Teredinibacter sp. KSP-S5-2]|uniref:rhomboid family intramembrane serine protease n=1 Tax=Teredinibacter sp. KSP-S5-2 TaxID=3034506 RepID=UPI00293486A5|nr:rhomboid family intramembrane serine protease [Teredinibacter sp. KSP-S5-2]WNO11074.1 rhomboid family intramembrane serine protease [Teredinibacter sp. KSP-S5-2]